VSSAPDAPALFRAEFERAVRSFADLSGKRLAIRDALNARIRSGEYVLEDHPCPCGAKEPNDLRLADVDRYDMINHLVLCTRCGLLRVNPRMNERAYERFYATEFGPLYGGNPEPSQRFERMRKKREGTARYLHAHVPLAGKDVLEIGAGGGWLLDHLRDKGARVVGYDFEEVSLALGRSKGIDLRHGSVPEALATGARFDIVILSHVLEHIAQPIELLRSMRNLLRDDGVLYVEVPGLLNDAHATLVGFVRQVQAAHLYYFTGRTLARTMTQAGYAPLTVDETIRSLWRSKHEVAREDVDASPGATVHDGAEGAAYAAYLLDYLTRAVRTADVQPSPAKRSLARRVAVQVLNRARQKLERR
jgi:2-polyprenyl-3-methyl-5-hydroxy-6-metoxy-1,4-benzoquinol methylase